MKNITISIVTHNQNEILSILLDQLSAFADHIYKVLITHNVVGENLLENKNYLFDIHNIYNSKPLGFGENHNRAFKFCKTSFFCVMNPDIQIHNDPFKKLMTLLDDPFISVVAPSITNLLGHREDNARYFPTPLSLLDKLFFGNDGVYPILKTDLVTYPDWVGGMFLLFSSDKFKELNGFDKNFYLYYEDVDFCIRSWKKGYKVLLCCQESVIHDARRSSRSNFKYFKWHIASGIRFFIKHLGRFPKRNV